MAMLLVLMEACLTEDTEVVNNLFLLIIEHKVTLLSFRSVSWIIFGPTCDGPLVLNPVSDITSYLED